MKKLILLTTIICTVCLASAQWVTQSPYPTSNTLWDVCFVDENTGWIAGDEGTILYSNDGGNIWTNQESSTTQALRSASFIDSNNGWIVGDSGIILRTTNGGEVWVDQSFTDTIHLYSVFFIGQIGWAAGMTISENGIIFYTLDGGNNWELQFYEADHSIRDICFTSLTSGWAASSHGVIHTENGGNTWQTQFSSNYYLNSIFFLDSLHGWSVGNERILHTIDGGISWETDTIQFGGLYDVLFTNSSNGYIVGVSEILGNSYRLFLRTIDGGVTWFNQSAPCGPRPKRICFINENKGWIVGAYGNITGTEDSGNNWIRNSQLTNDMMIADVCFLDDQNGLAIGYTYYTFNISYLLKTSNGGNDWLIKSNIGEYSGKLFVIDENNFWVIGNMFVHNTKDGGNTWGYGGPIGNYGTRDIFFTDVQNGWAACWNWSDDQGSIYHTSDEGENWEVQYIGEEEYLRSIYFIDQYTGWAVGRSGDSGIIINTIDGGTTWLNQLYINNQSFIKTHFFDPENGLAIGKHGSVFQTNNGGDNWTQVNAGFIIDISNVFVVNPDHIWIVGSTGQYPQPVFEGLIYHSGNGGQTWTEQESGTSRELGGIWFNNPNEGWIVGDYGTILHTENGGINEIPNVKVQNTNLHLANYPNPFSSNTTIEFTIQETGYVQLSVVDFTGKEVQILVSERITAGTQKFEWNAEGLPVGIYFLRLETNGTTETKKIIVMK